MKIEFVRENLNRKSDRFQWFDFLSGAAIGACAGMGLLMLAGLLYRLTPSRGRQVPAVL